MSLSSHQSARAKSTTWLTPPEWIEVLGPFDLDPCCPENMPWKTANRMLTKKDNGLISVWHGSVFCNPPFGRESEKWMAKMKVHGYCILLVAARTETKAFWSNVWCGGATAICFVRGRPHFFDINGVPAQFNSGAPICLVAWGTHFAQRLDDSNLGRTLWL